MNNRVLFIGGNFSPEPIGIGKYNGEMVDWLAGQGYDCTVITSFPYYPHWKVQDPYLKNSSWFKKEIKYVKPYYEKVVRIYRCPQFVPGNPTGSKRMLLDFSFCLTSFMVLFKLLFHKKYDYVISVVPCFQIGILAILYKAIRGGKFLYHVQDLQIDAARDLKMIKSSILIKCLFRLEKFILKQADVVSSISEGMMDKIKAKCDREINFFPNWVDTKLFFPITDKTALKEEFGFKNTDKVVLYSGAIGEKQGLEAILKVAESLTHIHSLKFVLCGSGPYLKKLVALKESLNLENVVFLATQPYEKLNRFLNMADLHLVIQKANASDLVMPSKLTAILAIGGVAVVTAPENSSLHNLITRHDMGLVIEPENLEALTGVICSSVFRNLAYVSTNARDYAEQYLSIGRILPRFFQNIQHKPAATVQESYTLQTTPSYQRAEMQVL